MSNLTETQLATLIFIKGYFQATGTVPTIGTIGKNFKISQNSAYKRFKQLVAREKIKANPGVKQGYEIL